MKESNLGELIPPNQQRDAIHIAIAPSWAAEELRPGQHVGLADTADVTQVSASARIKIGIVDPFLRNPVKPGQWFYVCLYPRTVTSLRHEWTHPLFERSKHD